MTYVFATIFVLGVLVFVHEFGHFIVAKLAGIRVEKFSLGFGPRMIGKTVGHTDYRISWIPLGGYCKMAGMVDESLEAGSIQGHPWEFQSKSALARLAVIVAGPGMNFLLAFLLLVMMGLVWGGDRPVADPVVGEVSPGRPAAEAGILADDRILRLDGRVVDRWEDLVNYIHPRAGQPIEVEWRHDGATRTATVVPVDTTLLGPEGMQRVGLIGIGPTTEHVRMGLIGALRFGYDRFVFFTGLIGGTLQGLLSGEASIRNLGGPIIIGKMAGDSASAGWLPLFSFMAFLSINLGLLNLLPLPILDGGHVVIIGIEALVRRPLPMRLKMAVLQMGFFLLMALMAFVIYNDLSRIFAGAQ